MLLMAGLLAADQVVKIWVRAEWALHRSVNVIPNFIDFTHVENRGVSFSVLGGLADNVRVPLLVGFSAAAVIALGIYWWRRGRSLPALLEWAFLLILPGAMGNLIDRAVYGTVTDYLHFRFYDTSFFVNNLADIFISLGVIAYIAGTLRRTPGRRG